MNVLEHIEAHLGTIDAGWKLPPSKEYPFHAIRVLDEPKQGVTAYSTLGMSRTKLRMNQRLIRQEFIIAAYEHYPSPKLASFLLTFGQYILARQVALLRGDVVGPYQPIIPNVSLVSVYASIPVMFDDNLATFHGTEPPTVFVWLMPITATEVHFIRTHGWSKFEDILEGSEVDFWDLDRPTIAEIERNAS